jgi:hypothetical protein
LGGNKIKKIIVVFILALFIGMSIPVLGSSYKNIKCDIFFYEVKDYNEDIKFYESKDIKICNMDELDQYQTTHDDDYLIGSDVAGYRLAQSFKPTLPKLTRFSLYLTSSFYISGWRYFNYRISLKKDSLNSPDILYGTIPTTSLTAGVAIWLTMIPSSPITVTPGDTYYIVIYGLEPATMGEIALHWFIKRGGSAYANGDGHLMNQPDPTWWPIFGGGDFCFKTYGEPSSNNPPDTPIKPSGPTSGSIGVSYSYATSTTDPDGDDVKYGWDWINDDLVDDWSGLQTSGTTCSMSHTWTNPGTYQIKVKAQDENSDLSAWSSSLTVVISAGNNPPNKPDTPSGATSGKTGTSYSYSTSTTDPENDQVYYWFDWGDGTNSDWDGPHDSGDTISLSHTWPADGTYPLKVKAKDTNGDESSWSETLSITMPKKKTINGFNPWIFKLIFRLIDLNF